MTLLILTGSLIPLSICFAISRIKKEKMTHRKTLLVLTGIHLASLIPLLVGIIFDLYFNDFEINLPVTTGAATALIGCYIVIPKSAKVQRNHLTPFLYGYGLFLFIIVSAFFIYKNGIEYDSTPNENFPAIEKGWPQRYYHDCGMCTEGGNQYFYEGIISNITHATFLFGLLFISGNYALNFISKKSNQHMDFTGKTPVN